jgi:hypothetical protein
MKAAPLRVLILGGYGVFGARLARLLADEPNLTLIIAGRSAAAAEAFCATLQGRAVCEPAAVDREGDLAGALERLAPDLLIDASGPFQDYGAAPYRVIEAALKQGIDALDFADGADFVDGIARFDTQARERGVAILSGVSSFPVLTTAVARHLAQGLSRVDRIAAGIAPSPYAGVGLNVIRAIASYAGKSIQITRGGRVQQAFALTDSRRFTIAPPGRLPLRNLRFSLIDVPDLKLLPKEWPGLDEIWIGAGPVPEILHRALNGLARLVRIGLAPTLAPLAPLLHYAINHLRWGEHRGGMFVTMEGARASDGAAVVRSWHLLAEGDDGPLIPAMALAVLVRRRLAGRSFAPGARAATRELELSDYETTFASRAIFTGTREEGRVKLATPLHARALGSAYDTLPARLRDLHDGATRGAFRGEAKVERGSHPLARLTAWLFGFPAAGDSVPVDVVIEASGEREIWRRNFAGRRFHSELTLGRGRNDRLLVERFGAARVALALVVDGGRLRLVPRRMSIFGISLPSGLLPRGESYESEVDGRFSFYVEIALPLAGLVVRYRGQLTRI